MDCKAKTAAFAELREGGRVDAYWIVVMGARILIIKVYGWTAGDYRDEQAELTDDLMCIVFDEMEAWAPPAAS